MINLKNITGWNDVLDAKNAVLKERLSGTAFSFLAGKYNSMAEIYSKKHGIRANIIMNESDKNNNMVRITMHGVSKRFSITKNIKLILKDLTVFFTEFKPIYEKKIKNDNDFEEQEKINEYQIEALDKFLGEHESACSSHIKTWKVGKYFELDLTYKGYELSCVDGAPDSNIELLKQLVDLK
jgi:hypothetical protein